jgi:hypothetical protein
MSTEDEYALLAENFSRSGYLIERRLIGGVDSIVVVGKPDRVNGITLYKRSIQLHQDAECQWHTSLGTATLPWRQSSESLRDFVLEIMESTDAEYSQEQQRRIRSVDINA